MKRRIVTTLLAAALAASVVLSGCGVDLTNINEEETTLSAELEAANLSDGTLQLHVVLNDTDSARLSGVTVTFYAEEEVLFSGTTDENGLLDACTLPGNTTITCQVASGATVLASTDFIFKISSEYSDLTIYTVDADDDSERIAEIPATEDDIRAAIYVTEEGRLSLANLTPYQESYDAVEEVEEEILEGTIETEEEIEETEEE